MLIKSLCDQTSDVLIKSLFSAILEEDEIVRVNGKEIRDCKMCSEEVMQILECE